MCIIAILIMSGINLVLKLQNKKETATLSLHVSTFPEVGIQSPSLLTDVWPRVQFALNPGGITEMELTAHAQNKQM